MNPLKVHSVLVLLVLKPLFSISNESVFLSLFPFSLLNGKFPVSGTLSLFFFAVTFHFFRKANILPFEVVLIAYLFLLVVHSLVVFDFTDGGSYSHYEI